MGSTDIQLCMEASNWMQGPISHELASGTGLDSPTSVDDAMFGCGQQLIERRLRPPQDQSLKCPRCDSTHTKFCYYNNYSLSQPRYFCKTCRRYWTKGGTLRNIPVGGGCRKNTKKSSSSSASKKPSADLHRCSSSTSPLLLTPQHNSNDNNNNSNSFPSPFPLSILGHEQPHTAADLHLAFPEQIHFSSLSLNHAAEMFASNPPATATSGPGFMLDNPARFDFMGRKNEAIAAAAEVYSTGNFCGQPYYNTGTFSSLDHQQRMMMMMPVVPYEEGDGVFDDVKPNGKMENQLPQPHSFGYNFGGLGSWTGLMNGYGASTTNSLV